MNEKHNPVVILPGINHSPTFLYDSDGNPVTDKNSEPIGGSLLFPDVDAAKEKLGALVKKLAVVSFIQNSDFVYERAYDVGCAAFAYQKCNMSGDCVNNLITKRWDYPVSEMNDEDRGWVYLMVPIQRLAKKIGEENIYFFTYNLVGDPMNSAQELDNYIDIVKEQRGCDKVTLLPISLGGTILAAYLDLFGHEKINKIVNIVACLDGTPIAADFFAQNFKSDDEYLHHEFLASVLKEETGKGTPAYLINALLHALPKEAFNLALTGFVNSLLDTVMINSPQFWAMVPCARYDELALKLIGDAPHAKLRLRTDRFQTARLNLKKNLLAAVGDGVGVNSISGSNLNFGEKMYSFFGIAGSAEKYNSDGIVSLSSATLGATGAANGKKLPESYLEAAKKREGGSSYISPDERIDVSSAALPDNTWIFIDQYHEVGRNDAVLNLAQALILGEIDNVHSSPERYPQFNRFCDTYGLRRWKIPAAEKLIKDIDSGTVSCSDSRKQKIQSAIDRGYEVLEMTVGDSICVQAASDGIDEILREFGRLNPGKKESKKDEFAEEFTRILSKSTLKYLGGGNIVDKIKHMLRMR